MKSELYFLVAQFQPRFVSSRTQFWSRSRFIPVFFSFFTQTLLFIVPLNTLEVTQQRCMCSLKAARQRFIVSELSLPNGHLLSLR